MRRIALGVVVITAALATAGAVPASALAIPSAVTLGVGVVNGYANYYGTNNETSFQADFTLSFVGTAPVGGSTYLGPFTVTGRTNDIPLFTRSCDPSVVCAPPFGPALYGSSFTGNLALMGSNPVGDAIAGSCGDPGSSIHDLWVSTNFVSLLTSVTLVCSVSLNAATPVPVTLTVAYPHTPSVTNADDQILGAFTAT